MVAQPGVEVEVLFVTPKWPSIFDDYNIVGKVGCEFFSASRDMDPGTENPSTDIVLIVDKIRKPANVAGIVEAIRSKGFRKACELGDIVVLRDDSSFCREKIAALHRRPFDY